MKRFRFRLETVLRLRRIREEKALAAFARYRGAAEAIEVEVAGLQREREAEIEGLRRGLAGGARAEGIIDANAYLYATARKIDRRLQALAAVRLQEARARTVWQEAQSARRALEELREQRLAAWRLEASREEQREVDEASSLRAARLALQRGGVLSALGVVLVIVLLAAGGGLGFLVGTGRLTRGKVLSAAAVLKGEPLPAPAKKEGKPPAEEMPGAALPEGTESPIERARKLTQVSQALAESVRENERHAERKREEILARRRMLELLRDDLAREIEDLKKQELVVRKERESLAHQGPQPAVKPKGVEAEGTARYAQMMKKMKPREIKELLTVKSDEEVADSLVLLDVRLSAKVMQEFLSDPRTAGRAPRISELVQSAGKAKEGQ